MKLPRDLSAAELDFGAALYFSGFTLYTAGD
jgi:hypothetical protein